MLVFSPDLLPQIFDSLITNYPLTFKDPTPANTLYMLARFACLTCDHTWLEDLIIGATDSIEETFFVRCFDAPIPTKLTICDRIEEKTYHASFSGSTTPPCGFILWHAISP